MSEQNFLIDQNHIDLAWEVNWGLCLCNRALLVMFVLNGNFHYTVIGHCILKHIQTPYLVNNTSAGWSCLCLKFKSWGREGTWICHYDSRGQVSLYLELFCFYQLIFPFAHNLRFIFSCGCYLKILKTFCEDSHSFLQLPFVATIVSSPCPNEPPCVFLVSTGCC